MTCFLCFPLGKWGVTTAVSYCIRFFFKFVIKEYRLAKKNKHGIKTNCVVLIACVRAETKWKIMREKFDAMLASEHIAHQRV